ncbi:MAG TPA: preprotein translocase subunit SecG [Candidatus Omnitrophota bacterium]|nr:preprotein translocase subunit SecG [Candidatus Omnitrophota bacterium]
MSIFLTAIHVIACLCLILLILIQQGKGGGLVQSLSNVENMFGTKTSAFLTKTTSIFAIIFFITCLSLALISAQRGRSLMQGYRGNGAIPAGTKTNAPEPAKAAATEKNKEETKQAASTAKTTEPQKEMPKEEAAKPDANKTGK